MAWYTTGTVDVTNGSATVTGTGTAWVSGIRAGWGWVGPDGKIYEIVSVASDTSMTIAPAYLGSTQTGQTYQVFPTQGLEAGLVASLDALLTSVQDTIDGAGEGKFGNGTAATPGIRFEADEDTGLYRVAANQLGLSAGGTQRALVSSAGLDAINLLRGGSQVFSRDNIIATVTESSGVPTGGLIENGSNSNGEYVRFADGTQICARRNWVPASGGSDWTFPVAFLSQATTSVIAVSTSLTARMVRALSSSATVAAVEVFDDAGADASSGVTTLAFGKWF